MAALVIPADAALGLGSRPGGLASYGSGIGADALNNTIVGGREDQAVSYRFRATTTSRLESIRVYIMTGSGYSSGDHGTLRITVRPNQRGVPSRRVLASRTVSSPSFKAGAEYRFPSPPTLRRGRLYHIVFENVDGSPGRNYVSLDGLFTFDRPAIFQPAFRNSDWAQLVKPAGERWGSDRGGRTTPIMGLRYANGHRSGLGYMEVWVDDAVRISGTHRVRQTFRVSGRSRSVTAVAVRLKRNGGSDPLEVRLWQGDRLVMQGRIPSDRIPQSSMSARGGSRWVSLDFPGRLSLRRGQSYRLILSSPSGTEYSIFAIRQGGTYGYDGASFFTDGRAEHDSGGGWRPMNGWGRPSTEADLQFYFR